MVDTTKLLYAKKETTYGVEVTGLVTGGNSVLTRNFSAKPFAVDTIERNIDRPVRGGTRVGTSNVRQTIGYELELAGSGTAGTAPAWMEHLEACGMAAPVLVATTSATQRFTPIGTALSSLSVAHWHGSQKRIGIGARGTFSFDFTAGSFPFVKLDMTALLGSVPIVDEVPASPGFVRWKDPLEVNTANTDFMLGGYAAVLRSLTGEIGANIATRNLVGGNYIQRGNHRLTGKIVCEAPTVAAKNYFGTLQAGTEIPCWIEHGVVAGNIVRFDMNTIQITDIDLQDEDDVLMLSLSYLATTSNSPDDLVIIAR